MKFLIFQGYRTVNTPNRRNYRLPIGYHEFRAYVMSFDQYTTRQPRGFLIIRHCCKYIYRLRAIRECRNLLQYVRLRKHTGRDE